MYYVQDEKKLRDVFNILAAHSNDVKQYSLAGLKPRVLAFDRAEDRLCVLFALANAQRQGTGKDNANLKEATRLFGWYLRDNVLGQLKGIKEPSEAHKYFLEKKLCDIPGMDQKTANLFLRYLWMFQDEFELGALYDWKSWENCLHVPLDLWVLRLMGNHCLSVCNERFESDFGSKKKEGGYVSPGLKKEEYCRLQSDIAEVAKSAGYPAIVLDSLWFVGNRYCEYRPILCRQCWVGKQCQRYEEFDFYGDRVPTKSEEEEFEKMMKWVIARWISDHPGRTRDDFMKAKDTPEFREWWDRREEAH